MVSNLVAGYQEFRVQAVKRMEIINVKSSQDDGVIKTCDIKILDDVKSFNLIPKDKKMVINSRISEVRKDAVTLLELYGQIFKSQYTMYIGMINRVNKATPVEMLFNIMEFLMEKQPKIIRQMTLEVSSYETRL